jgi:hypothetical protein
MKHSLRLRCDGTMGLILEGLASKLILMIVSTASPRRKLLGASVGSSVSPSSRTICSVAAALPAGAPFPLAPPATGAASVCPVKNCSRLGGLSFMTEVGH